MGFEISIRIHPARLSWPEAVRDLDSIDHNTTHLRLVSKAKGIDQLKYLNGLKSLWCFDINEKSLSQICDCRSLENLYIAGLKTVDFSCIRRLSSLKILRIERCLKIDSLDQLGRLESLEGLGIEGFKNVQAIDPLSQLTNLRELEVSGTIWTRMTIESLKPLSGLHNLHFLSITNLKVMDESLRPLGNLNQLQTLHIGNLYPMEEFAWLSGKLKNVDCDWFRAFIATGLKCPKCNRSTAVMLTGKGTRLLCSECDAGRLAQHIAKFIEIAANAS